ncbi:hypothetical protein HHI_04750 [Hyphomonas hirschiana VP5]|uniref:Uncharacterized protein n=1 Tax=Hyphomonas hirschiana VP5 TaxID=1280951 RepID=A0A059FY42_9PROT|nr:MULTISPECIES: hypothetical protein [Hyphomonas]KCZ95436.1 hypothetical protein HHI_04750 [Hyphomonas hirschiana VP5]
MIESRVPLAKSKTARAPRGAWKLLRGLFLMLMAAHWSAQHLAPGKLKTGALRALARHIGALEHGLRCLLILMRATPARPATLPAGLLARRAAPPRPRRKAARFALGLAQLANGFARYGHDTSALASIRKAPPPRPAPPPRGPTASAPMADPAEALRTRLEAMRAVFSDPQTHAAKLAARLRAKGLRLRGLKSLIPAAALWLLTSYRAAPAVHARLLPAPNTS